MFRIVNSQLEYICKPLISGVVKSIKAFPGLAHSKLTNGETNNQIRASISHEIVFVNLCLEKCRSWSLTTFLESMHLVHSKIANGETK